MITKVGEESGWNYEGKDFDMGWAHCRSLSLDGWHLLRVQEKI